MGHDHVDSSAAYIHLAPSFLREEFDAARARLRAAFLRSTCSPPTTANCCVGSGLITGSTLAQAARTFLRRWPDPQRWADEPLDGAAGAASADTRSFVMFLMLAGHLRPGYDYLIRRKLAELLACICHPARWPTT